MAPIAWGVSAVDGWGHQIQPERVLSEAVQLGVDGIEAVPLGYFRARPRGRRKARLMAGFLHTVVERSGLPAIDAHARSLKRLGAAVLVLAAGRANPSEPSRVEAGARKMVRRRSLSPAEWAAFFDALAGVESICHQHRLVLAFHPQLGSLVADQGQLERFLVGCETGLCLDTGELVMAGLDPAEVVELAPKRIVHVHLKEVDDELGAAVREGRLTHREAVQRGLFPPLGRDSSRSLKVLDALRHHRYARWIVLEQERMLAAEPGPGQGPFLELRKSLEVVRST